MNLNKRLLPLLLVALYVLGTGVSPAQTQGGRDTGLSFTVRDAESHEPLVGVACRVFTSVGKFYNYAIADGKGRLSVTACHGDSLEFSFIGYGKLKEPAASFSSSETNLVELVRENVMLREVAITAPPISARSDTLIYNVAAFVGQGDTHLEDVLRKMPGIKVADNGTVSYQGKAINKFYIEGRDLLGGSYNQATRNMPVDAVTSVEVLENHQPVKMLQGQQFTDQAALNIRIDKAHMSRPFGEVEGGIGCSPTIWNNRIFLTQILGESQLMVTGKMNNTGIDISDETKEHIDITDIDAYEPLASGLLSPSPGIEVLPQNRYLRNNSYSLGLNYLTGLSKDATLRMNVLFYEDRSGYSDLYAYTYGGAGEAVSVSETNARRMKTLTVMPILKYELNGRKAYVSDELRYQFNTVSTRNKLVSNGADVTENISTRPYYLQNYLSASFSLGRQIVQAKSFLRYLERRESLTDVSDSALSYNVAGRYSTRSLVAKHLLSTTFQLRKSSIDLGARAYYRDDRYGYDGTVHRRKLQLRLQPGYTLLFGTDRTLTVELPVEYMRIGLSPLRPGGRGKFFFNPDIYFKYKLTDKWKLRLSASVTADDMAADFYSPYALRTAYRNVSVSGDDVFFSIAKSVRASLGYRNLATMLFANLVVSYADVKNEGYASYDYTDTLTTVTYIRGDNHRRSLMASATLDKNFTRAGVVLKGGIDYSRTSYLLAQSGLMTQNKSDALSLNFGITCQKLKWLRIYAGVTGTASREHNSMYKSDILSSFKSNASLYLFPLKGMEVKMTYQNYTNEISKSEFATCDIFDISAKYKISKIVEAGATVTNLLNVGYYTVTQNTGIDTFSSRLPLRGREVLFSLMLRI